MRRLRLLAAALLASWGVSAQAAAVFFGEDQGVFQQSGAPTGAGAPNSTSAQADFLSHLVGVGTETFEAFADTTGAPLALVFPGAGTATLQGGGAVDDDPGTGQNAISGTKWWRTGAGNNFAIDFDSPVAAFGFFGVDVGDIGAQLTLTLLGGGTVSIDIPHTVAPGGPTSPQNGSVIYFGYIDALNPFTRVEFANLGGGGGDDFGFDDMTIGSVQQVVPEPASLALAGLALSGLAAASRRRQRQAANAGTLTGNS